MESFTESDPEAKSTTRLPKPAQRSDGISSVLAQWKCAVESGDASAVSELYSDSSSLILNIPPDGKSASAGLHKGNGNIMLAFQELFNQTKVEVLVSSDVSESDLTDLGRATAYSGHCNLLFTDDKYISEARCSFTFVFGSPSSTTWEEDKEGGGGFSRASTTSSKSSEHTSPTHGSVHSDSDGDQGQAHTQADKQLAILVNTLVLTPGSFIRTRIYQ
ncbi:unnamed protein product [Vitrella brassicaformis CCMP3155]|uniref:SnoaL-like domain-containing protein n=2 Tax=Vitrella brassicaformis TaxID=1169539 RepID=A0A0G4EHG0_VITBC|nr:unnamed protein product [Vitrella brassicaformis CCMP3155]|eukprot:CEL95460.1 unnamed protein product [Vitrella brassicaformis CCMP3155]